MSSYQMQAVLAESINLDGFVNNRIRTSRFHFATADRPKQERESQLAVAHVAIDTPSALPCLVHAQQWLRARP